MQLLKSAKTCLVVLAISGLAACSSSESAKEQVKTQYTYVAEDALIIGMKVEDAVGNQATEISPGEYQFALGVVPTPPVEFRSQNTDENPFATYQDIDESGDLSEADLAYSVGFDMQFVPPANETTGQAAVFANPIAALIPATGVPANGIGGIPANVINEAINKGVKGAATTQIQINGEETTIKEVIAKTSAKITAIQEALVAKSGQKVSGGNTASIKLLQDASLSSVGSLTDDTKFAEFFDAAINNSATDNDTKDLLKQAAIQVGANIAAVKAATTGTQKVVFESIIKVVQQQVKTTTTSSQVANLIKSSTVTNSVKGINTSIKLAEEVKNSGGKAAFINSLLLIPVPGTEAPLIEDNVSGFELTFNATNNQIAMAATGAFFDGLNLTYDAASATYFAVTGSQAVFVSLSANSQFLPGADIGNVRLMATCSFDFTTQTCGANNQALGIYTLATKAELCSQFDNAPANESFLQNLNANYGDACNTGN
ncbi:hypothetical protein [Catenovulum sediminis]|uniref:hypothetical protein n=1 Tax=Catenovulum sediminis TaxID=1740262 RepID=UPI00117E4EFF|nr:hypothetical protein [Catenovulum sediminis]